MTGNGLTQDVLAWLMSYAIHSTILLGGAWLFTRRRTVHPATAELIWKSALVGGLITATVQTRLDLRPSGSIALAPATATAAATSTPRDAEVRNAKPDEEPNTPVKPSPGAPAATTAASLPASSIAVAAWGALALILAVAYAARRLILVGRLGDRQAVVDGPASDAMKSLAAACGWRQRVSLTSSRSISSPVALGLGEVCLPVAALTDLDEDQQRSMLAHELAHLVRRDPVWLDVASVIERVFFFQPLNRVARREMQAAAEYLCDDWAARHAGSGVPLARCLAKVAEWMQASPLGVPMAGMAEQRSLLVSRIARLIDTNGLGTPRSRRTLGVIAVGVLGAMVFVAPRVAGRGVDTPANPISIDDAAGAAIDESGAPDAASRNRAVERSKDRQRVMASSAAADGDTTIVLALIARLKDDDAQVRRAAAHSLGRLEDPRAVPPLIVATRDEDAQVRSAAVDALGDFEDPRAIGALADRLADKSAEVRQTALNALSHFDKGVPATPVIALLDDAEVEVRHEAAHLLGHIGDRAAVAPLTRLVKDASPDVRQAAIEALSELGDPAASSAILGALADGEADVRQQALNGAEQLRIAIPEATLLQMLRDPSAEVRASAASLAGERSIVASVPLLRRMLDDASGDVRESAIDALSEIVDPSAREALRAALNSSDAKVRRRAAEALGERN